MKQWRISAAAVSVVIFSSGCLFKSSQAENALSQLVPGTGPQGNVVLAPPAAKITLRIVDATSSDAFSPVPGRLSANGDFMVFSTYPIRNIVKGEPQAGAATQVILKSTIASSTSAESIMSSTDGTIANAGNLSSGEPDLSSDGRYVVFSSTAKNFGVTTGVSQIYLKDLKNMKTMPVLVSSMTGVTRTAANAGLSGKGAFFPRISANGRYVSFVADSTNLGVVTGTLQVYVKDMNNLTSPPVIVSSSDGTASGVINAAQNGDNWYSSISQDGKYVLFEGRTSQTTDFVTAYFPPHFYLKDITQMQAPPVVFSPDVSSLPVIGSPVMSGSGQTISFSQSPATITDEGTQFMFYSFSSGGSASAMAASSNGAVNPFSLHSSLSGDGTRLAMAFNFSTPPTAGSSDVVDAVQCYVQDTSQADYVPWLISSSDGTVANQSPTGCDENIFISTDGTTTAMMTSLSIADSKRTGTGVVVASFQ
jgi:hypothetical protein